ncbi:MAG: hypothetical protein HOP31_07155 [Ignavibacteria bacterium]|nr:hypothetical protein [Ignavibacteria bacterium]
MAKNQKKITIASFNSLLEFSAIPYETRIAYLNKLLVRKNSANQKNITLLKMLYRYADENIIYKWQPDEVSQKLGVTPAALYKLKSRLLSGLRAYYCKWNDSEHKTSARIKYTGSQLNGTEKKISIKLRLAFEMNDAGLRKEAKDKFIKIEKVLLIYKTENKFKYLNLAHIYERLMIYYHVKNDKLKLSEIFPKLQQAASSADKFGLSEVEQTQLGIWVNYISFIKDKRVFLKKYDRAGIITSLKKVYREALRIRSYDYVLRALNGLASTENDSANYPEAEIYAGKGYEISCKLGYEEAKYFFASMLYITRIPQGNNDVPIGSSDILQYYHKLKKAKPLNHWAFYLENSCGKICMLLNMKESSDFYKARANSNILMQGHPYAAYMLFEAARDDYYNSLCSSFVVKDGWAYLDKINNALLESSENSCLITLHYNKAMNDMGFIWEVYLQLLITLYFREDSFDYERALLTINKMDRLIKNKRKVTALSTYRLLKLAVNILEHSDNPENMLLRYEYKFKKAVDFLINNPKEIDIFDYAVISSLARRLRCKEITAIVKDLYYWIDDNHPEILAPALREIEERTSKIKLIDGTKQSAA